MCYEENLTDEELEKFSLWAWNNTGKDYENLFNRDLSQQFYEKYYPIYLDSLKK